jgi:transcriptional regulator GlxA family with amidase domain
MPTTPRIPPARRRVEILAFPGVNLLDLAGPLQVLASADEQAGGGAYDLRVVAAASPVASSAGPGIEARPLPRPGAPIDTLIVAGGRGVQAATADLRLVRWVAARAAAARRLASICSGAFLLGAAGLLDGRRCATHWQEAAALARAFPRARVEPDPIFVRDGPVWSSAGVTAGIDLALALVADDLGHAAAMAVARDLVVFLKRPGGQAQFSTALDLQSRGGGSFEALHGWIAGHPAADLSVAALAARAGMSERSFARRYRAATGLTPACAVEALRVEAARRLLEARRAPIKRVAAQAGFGSEETMRRSFLRRLGVTPQDYRDRFSSARSPGRTSPASPRPA